MSKGGFRWGAGRPGWHAKAEYCLRLDVRALQRGGLLSFGNSGVLRWLDEQTGAQTGSVATRATADAVLLDYAIDGKPTQQRVPILRSDCHYGGTRPWFTCARCGKRLAVLYFRATGFACRACNQVAYLSQSEDPIDRMRRRQGKLELRLDKGWKRPKGMHAATRNRLVRQIIELGDRWELAMEAAQARMFPGAGW